MERRTLHRLGLVGVVAIALPLVHVGLALGTSGSGVSSAVTGRFTSEDKIKTRGNQPFDVITQTVTIQPGGHTGWHAHPGQAIVLIKAGSFTTYDASDPTCTPHVYGAGDVYVDHGYGDVHIARNEGTVPTELAVTYLDVPVGSPFRLDGANPGNCPF